MKTIQMEYKQLLVIDPCYIKSVKGFGENRFDALKLVRVLHDGDDGVYRVYYPNGKAELGVDSGRLWVLQAEFECEVEVDSGLSGHLVLPAETQVADVYRKDFRFTQDEWAIFQRLDRDFLKEDIVSVANDLGYELDDKEVERAMALYEHCESMEYAKSDTLTSAIEETVKERQ